MQQAGEDVAMDARPSDAIALALRWDCPIFVSRGVLGRTRQAEGAVAGKDTDELKAWLENLGEEDTGGYKM